MFVTHDKLIGSENAPLKTSFLGVSNVVLVPQAHVLVERPGHLRRELSVHLGECEGARLDARFVGVVVRATKPFARTIPGA
jgi:hypothetical protein